jgi:hypothetical protein
MRQTRRNQLRSPNFINIEIKQGKDVWQKLLLIR